MNKKVSLLASALLAGSVMVACGGSGPSDLVPGERVDIRLGFTGHKIGFEIEEAGFYVLSTSGDEDTVCEIHDASGSFIAEDDDSGVDYNCMISSLLKAGRYTATIEGFDFTDRGRTSVLLEALPVQEVAIDEVVNLTLDYGLGSVLAIDINESAAVMLSTSGQVDTDCVLYDSDGNELAYNYDYGDGSNCGLVQRMYPGRYYFVVRDYAGSGGRTTFMAASTDIRTVQLGLGEPQDSVLNDPLDMVDFVVNITEPGMYVFHTTGDTDTYCKLIDGEGRVMAENDDFNDHNCRIQHALTEGEYWFSVTGYSGSIGEFGAQANKR